MESGTLCIATIDFLVKEAGGHHYGFLSHEKVVHTGMKLADEWIAGLKKDEHAEIQLPAKDKNIKIDDGFMEGPVRLAELLTETEYHRVTEGSLVAVTRI